MKSTEVEGTTFVKDYTEKRLTKLELAVAVLCACALAVFLVRLSV